MPREMNPEVKAYMDNGLSYEAAVKRVKRMSSNGEVGQSDVQEPSGDVVGHVQKPQLSRNDVQLSDDVQKRCPGTFLDMDTGTLALLDDLCRRKGLDRPAMVAYALKRYEEAMDRAYGKGNPESAEVVRPPYPIRTRFDSPAGYRRKCEEWEAKHGRKP